MWWEQEETTLHSIQTVGFNFHHKMAPIGSRPRLQIFLPYSAQCFARNKALKLFVLSLSWPLLHVGKLPFCTGFWWPWLHSHCDVGKVKSKSRFFPLRNCSGCSGPPNSFCIPALTLKAIMCIVLIARRLSNILRAMDHELRLAAAGNSASPDVIVCGWLGSKHQLTN